MIVPLHQAGEAKLVAGIEDFGVGSITQLVAFLRGTPMPPVDPMRSAVSGPTATRGAAMTSPM
jgi:hypothetical protein